MLLPRKLRPPQWSTKTAEMMNKVDIIDQMYIITLLTRFILVMYILDQIYNVYICDHLYIYNKVDKVDIWLEI